MRRRHLASAGLAVCLATALPAHAGTTRYYFDPVGRLIGSLQDDGSDRTSRTDTADNINFVHQFGTAPAVSQDTLQSGGIQIADQGLTSTDGRFHLAIQDDGNLVVYEGSTALWAANTSGHLPGYLIMQSDGNLVFYGPDDSVIWQSQTSGYPNSHLNMATDGNLIIYQGSTVVWQSGSGGH